MKAAAGAVPERTAAIVHLAGAADPSEADPEQRARAFAEPLLNGQVLDTGEDALGHADGVVDVLRSIGAGAPLRAAAYLVYAGDYLQRPEEVVNKAFGASYGSLVTLTRQLVQIQRAARAAQVQQGQRAMQTERVRKMLLAFSRDLRVVLLRLASRLQTLRWFASSRTPCPPALALESQQVFAPLANRLGIWQIKWEMEDLAFRFLQPAEYQRIARLVDERRIERDAGIRQAQQQLAGTLRAAGLTADLQGRSKHLYSIWKKMQHKDLPFERVLDSRALRVVVGEVATCYVVLARVHELWPPIGGEFDDYIARPKGNGYQSLHTVVHGPGGLPLEVQIRTRAMHEHAEHGVAAHWMYKEAGPRAATAAVSGEDGRVAEARKSVLRELLAWERDFSGEGEGEGDAVAGERGSGSGSAAGPTDRAGEGYRDRDRIYVFTPQATVIDLPAGGTPVDFAYALHTDLGHRCRGARIDGALVPLHTLLRSGQTVEIVAAREGGPSLDWLNPELRFLGSPRSRAKVRAWFNSEQQAQTVARGREAVEKLLQRSGRTAIERDALAVQLGFKNAQALFEIVGKDEFSLRNIENLLRPAEPVEDGDRVFLHAPRSEAGGGRGGVLVVGMDSLLTTLGRCCRPAPPDRISGYVTRGRGVAVHRSDCNNLREMAARSPGRVIDVAWGQPGGDKPAVYPLDAVVEAGDRPGLLRDISEVFAREKVNVTAVHTQSTRPGAAGGATAWMTFTVEVADASRLTPVLAQVARVPGVRHARRR